MRSVRREQLLQETKLEVRLSRDPVNYRGLDELWFLGLHYTVLVEGNIKEWDCAIFRPLNPNFAGVVFSDILPGCRRV